MQISVELIDGPWAGQVIELPERRPWFRMPAKGPELVAWRAPSAKVEPQPAHDVTYLIDRVVQGERRSVRGIIERIPQVFWIGSVDGIPADYRPAFDPLLDRYRLNKFSLLHDFDRWFLERLIVRAPWHRDARHEIESIGIPGLIGLRKWIDENS